MPLPKLPPPGPESLIETGDLRPAIVVCMGGGIVLVILLILLNVGKIL